MSTHGTLARRWAQALGRCATAHVDWRIWTAVPAAMARRVAAIDRRAVVVAYPSRSGRRPASRVPPCTQVPSAELQATALARLRAAEHALGGRHVLVAYELPSASRRL
jgi:hypothetical protein